MQAYIEQAKQKFDELDLREKLLVGGGSITLAIILFVFLVVVPTYEKADTLREDIQFNQEDVEWMQNASKQLSSSGGTNTFSGANRSLLALLDEQFKSMNLASSVKSIQPDGKSKAKVRLENCEFDNLINLVAKLENDNNVIVLRTSFKKSDAIGRIDGSITFSRG